MNFDQMMILKATSFLEGHGMTFKITRSLLNFDQIIILKTTSFF
jgi:hypothetical protein